MILSKLVILVVDDEPALCEILSDEFQDLGAKVTAVNSVEQAWKALSEEKFDVVLSDLRMPGANGTELFKKISSELKVKPVLFLYTGCLDFNIDEVKKYGVIKVFAKPFDMAHMTQIIADSVIKKL